MIYHYNFILNIYQILYNLTYKYILNTLFPDSNLPYSSALIYIASLVKCYSLFLRFFKLNT